jgi:hypothetical protein
VSGLDYTESGKVEEGWTVSVQYDTEYSVTYPTTNLPVCNLTPAALEGHNTIWDTPYGQKSPYSYCTGGSRPVSKHSRLSSDVAIRPADASVNLPPVLVHTEYGVHT